MIEDCLRRDPAFARVLASSVGTTTTSEISTLQTSKAPFLILHGGRERIVKLDFLEKLAKELPSVYMGKVQIVPTAGHTPQFESPQEFNKIMLDFAHSVFKP
jgi:pimeloyl-ACP methyl ester carboxylesterase